MHKRHSGFMMLVIAVLLVVFAGLAVAFVAMISSGSNSSTSTVSANAAHNLAHTAMEEGSYALSQNQSNCSSTWSAVTAYGGGTYQYNCTHYDTTATLTSALNATATSIPLSSTSNFASFGAVTINSETIYYNGVSGNTLLNARRGKNGSSAAAHASGATVTQKEYVIMGRAGVPSLSAPFGQRTVGKAVLVSQSGGGSGYYAVGNNGVMLKYDGTAWSTVLTASGVTFRDIEISSNYGFAVGNGGSNRISVYAFNGSTWSGPTTLSIYTSYNGAALSGPTSSSTLSHMTMYSIGCNMPGNPTQCWLGGGVTNFGNQQPGPTLCFLTPAATANCYINTNEGNSYVNDISCKNDRCMAAFNNNNFYTFNPATTTPYAISRTNAGSQTFVVGCSSGSRCIVATNNGIRYYYNTSSSYSQTTINGFSPTGVSCPSNDLCMMSGNNGRIYSCALGATSMTCTLQTNTGSMNYSDIHCNATNDCLAVGSGSTAYRFNGSWSATSAVPGNPTLNAVSGVAGGGSSSSGSGLEWL